jgi:hypothetical protein
MSERLVMARVVGRTDNGLRVRPMGAPDSTPHSMCPKLSWCQPAEVALAALQKDQPLPRRG